MFKRLKLRLQDMKTIKALITGADEQANLLGEEEPGAEHFLLSALNLPDGSAKRVFKRLDTDPSKFLGAIEKQYKIALDSIGVSPDTTAVKPEPIESGKLFPNSKPSGQEVMKSLYSLKKNDKDKPILGAHVVTVVANMKHGVAARALKAMGIERDSLAKAALDELNSMT